MTETEAKWAERVREWKESGKSLKEFGEGKPYRASTLGWWSTELKRRTEAPKLEKKRPARKQGRTIQLAPVVRRVADAQSGGMVVELGAARIRVHRGFDQQLLVELIAALGGPR